jgi:hypothetical protein
LQILLAKLALAIQLSVLQILLAIMFLLTCFKLKLESVIKIRVGGIRPPRRFSVKRRGALIRT